MSVQHAPVVSESLFASWRPLSLQLHLRHLRVRQQDAPVVKRSELASRLLQWLTSCLHWQSCCIQPSILALHALKELFRLSIKFWANLQRLPSSARPLAANFCLKLSTNATTRLHARQSQHPSAYY
jgi:hypothetical protein